MFFSGLFLKGYQRFIVSSITTISFMILILFHQPIKQKWSRNFSCFVLFTHLFSKKTKKKKKSWGHSTRQDARHERVCSSPRHSNLTSSVLHYPVLHRSTAISEDFFYFRYYAQKHNCMYGSPIDVRYMILLYHFALRNYTSLCKESIDRRYRTLTLMFFFSLKLSHWNI